MAKTLSAGDLVYAVAFDSRADANDGMGNKKGAWVERFRCRACYRHLRGGEVVIAARLEGVHPQLISVRNSSQTRAVTNDWQVRDTRTGRVFAIRDVTEETDRQWITLVVASGQAT